MLRLTLDTYCVIVAAQNRNHRAEVDRLVDLARAGHVELWLTSAFTYDQATAPADKYAVNRKWLAERPCIGTVPGPFRLDLSPLNGQDVLGDDATANADERIKAILLPEPLATGQVAAGSRMHDVHHLTAHLMAGNAAFVTNDNNMLKKREALRDEVGITVLNPAEAVILASGPSNGSE